MLLFRISLAAVFLGTCVAALDVPTTHYPMAMGHQARRGLAARHTVQELKAARDCLSPEAKSFFGKSSSMNPRKLLLPDWMN